RCDNTFRFFAHVLPDFSRPQPPRGKKQTNKKLTLRKESATSDFYFLLPQNWKPTEKQRHFYHRWTRSRYSKNKRTRTKYLTLPIWARKDWWQNKSSPRSAEKGLDTNKISHQSTSCVQDTGRVFSNAPENHAPLRRVQPKGNTGGNDKKLGFPALTFNPIRQNKSVFIE
ncbi:unnamed protein product, partial [Ixodes pacificus]